MTPEPAVISRMYALLNTWEATNDRRAIFLACYSMMTANMFGAIDKGEFQDVAWVSKLLHRFADYYFEAVNAYEKQDGCTAVWRFAFDAARKSDTHVMQNLILGVNAHINYDLVLALVDVLRAEWHELSPDARAQRYQDHRHVNTIIAATINSVQDQVIERYEPDMDLVDKLFGPVDEWIIARLIAGWREEVWRHADELMACADGPETVALQQKVEQRALTRAHAVAGKRGIAGILDLV